MIDYRERAEILTEATSSLQRQILVKHTKEILKAMHEELRTAKQDKIICESLMKDCKQELANCREVISTIYTEYGERLRIAELCNRVLNRNS